MRKLIVAVLAVSAIGHAENVYFSAKGKTYHKAASCSYLARTKTVLTADKAAAESHGLKPCSPCYRAKASAKDNSSWAKGAK